MTRHASFPWWLKPATRLIVLLNRLGMSPGDVSADRHHAALSFAWHLRQS